MRSEPLDGPSTGHSKPCRVSLLVPEAVTSTITPKVRKIQRSSATVVRIAKACLPLSTEKFITISGLSEGIRIASEDLEEGWDGYQGDGWII
jgi:hypothetical protein